MNLTNREDPDFELLFKLALDSRANAYSPYSNYKVGAALIDDNGNLHTGCNVESADYTLTTHAEMLAIDSMVKSGCLKVRKLLIVLESSNKPATPCGLCRQKMIEFSDEDLKIISVNIDFKGEIQNIYDFTLGELLPYNFNSSFLHISK